ncbi:MAG: dTDP-glucose 4,6-dehydratase, dTDP-glucose 4,6-dehydratase [Candidatus Peregrinibacteria bacterium GW2011_GWE2_39_6]|nr:MAG: dTDP-glucose 4,6-dehydratase, dTDP-glucose 4,6-dehydratase [Candidatus Peregrinibacteria bacterium GW2011_GWF2_39_17]KKR26798.1 MAG: dTDP-glucose 4,6-dehydratase, dTDP-glucose 4,6-dehydratase [Candidatus Peregrinibacteria bacterium GW2011_GWE2_39_6]HCW32869.1 dTDP-glucose 4,6-dehydratase [Candidatus Peregrinibacteria bacterium]
MTKILVTGGAGFIGSNFIHYWLKHHPEDEILNLDALTYAGNLENLRSIQNNKRYKFIQGDINDPKIVEKTMQKGIEVVINFAAESHNDRAIVNPRLFFETNVLGTQTLLAASLKKKVKRFHHISTCEVFGDLTLDSAYAFKENDPFSPRTPYNASKASANHAVMAYYHTYGLPVTLSHCSNNYGPYQFPEKIIPLFTTNLLRDKTLPLFKSSQNKREWIHVDDHCQALEAILLKGKLGQAYNIGTGVEKSIEEIANFLLAYFHKPVSYKNYIPDRLGHDRRYLLDSTKIKETLNWQPKIGFETGLKQTIAWYQENSAWWAPLL